MPMRERSGESGLTLIELLFAVAVAILIAGMALPVTDAALDDLHTGAAARYVAGVVLNDRMDALKRARSVALHFEPSGPDYVFEPYVDGNGNGVRTAEIRSGVDPSIGAGQRLSERFPGVTFGLQAGLPDADGVRSPKYRRHPHRLRAHPGDRTGRHRDVGHPVCAGSTRAVRGPCARSHGADACDEVRTGSRDVDQSLIDRRGDPRFPPALLHPAAAPRSAPAASSSSST